MKALWVICGLASAIFGFALMVVYFYQLFVFTGPAPMVKMLGFILGVLILAGGIRQMEGEISK